MKIDLRKVYDCIDWAFLCMLLMKIGLSNMSIEWIMGCISNAHFFVLINGKPTRFFTTGRGLKQGCALSPLLFILVMDYLSLKIHRAIRDGFFKGIKITQDHLASHNFFVDDILIFDLLIFTQWFYQRDILDHFGQATGMVENVAKSHVLHSASDHGIIRQVCDAFHYGHGPLLEGFTYLGFHLKPCKYVMVDWYWLIKKYQRKLDKWTLRWISLGGRHILTQSVLQNLAVYWVHLHIILVAIIKQIRVIMARFIWGDWEAHGKYHLACWDSIIVSKEQGVGGCLTLSFSGRR